MPNYSYVALDARGRENRGGLTVADENEALRRLKEMGFFPTKVVPAKEQPRPPTPARRAKDGRARGLHFAINIPGWSGRVKPRALTACTRQLATLVEAGLPLLRGLRLLEEQEESPALKQIIGELGHAIEGGGTFSEALAFHPKVFNRLYVNMVKAGELGGVLEVVLQRLAGFMEKAEKIKGRVVAAMFYPVAVLTVAVAILGVLMIFVVPRFKEVFDGLLNGMPLPAFTRFVLGLSETLKSHLVVVLGMAAAAFTGGRVFVRTRLGRQWLDRFKLSAPVFGAVIRKAAIARFARTLGTLVSSGVPILQALTIVKETAGNVIVGQAVASVHESVKEGETITAPLRASRVFPAVVCGMVDVGEQTGALPEMLMKIADNYDEEVDNAVAAMTSLLEPIMIVILAVVVGSIVVALFLPIIAIMTGMDPVDKTEGE